MADVGADRSLKFGVYEDDREVFDWVRKDAPQSRKCFEAQIMDFSDDVAYSVHDFEDAIFEGSVKLEQLSTGESALVDEIERWSGSRIPRERLAEAFNRLQENPYWLTEWSGNPRQSAQLKNLTSSVIGRFVSRTTEATFEANQDKNFARYAADIIVPDEVTAEIAIFKGIVSYFLMSAGTKQGFYESQRLILTELADALLASNGRELDAFSKLQWENAKGEVEKHRVIVDQIATLTDASAISMHEKLIGSKRGAK